MFHRSKRLLLRPGWIEDAPELTERIADRAIVRNLSRVPWPYSASDAVQWLSRKGDPKLPTFLLALPGETGSPIIGACGIHVAETGGIELGYWIARERWGQGFATEAARAVVSIAHMLGHRRLRGYHAFDNPASGRVLEKAGFRPTGRMRSFHRLGRGCWVMAPEFEAELGGCAGDTSPSEMAEAA